MILQSHPRYQSLIIREKLAEQALAGVVAIEGLIAHGRGEAFDYLLGEKTSQSALKAETLAAAMILTASHPVLSVNGNTAALAADLIAELQRVSGISVEVNLFHRTERRVEKINRLLIDAGVKIIEGPIERFIPLDHDRGLCHKEGVAAADLVFVPLEDGDRAEVLVKMGKKVIVIDLNPLSRSSQAATLPIIDDLRRALSTIIRRSSEITISDAREIISMGYDKKSLLKDALSTIQQRLDNVLD